MPGCLLIRRGLFTLKLRLSKAQGGFTLVEAVTSMLLAVIIMLSAASFIIEGTNITRRIEQKQRAELLADTLLKELQAALKYAAEIKAIDGSCISFTDTLRGENAAIAFDVEGHLYLSSGGEPGLLLDEAAYMGLKAALTGLELREGLLRGSLSISAEDRMIKTLAFTFSIELI